MSIYLSSKQILCGAERPGALVCLRGGLRTFRWRSSVRRSTRRPGMICSSLELEHSVRRKCSPLQESALLHGPSALNSMDWKAVPDIWRSTAEKYGDRIALVDPYHEPPSQVTYKQLEQEILDFSEGLRVVGIVPDEKLALFADNSCRWLVADQGIMSTGAINVVRGTRSSDEELLQIYSHSESVALVMDNPEFLKRLAESFISRVDIRFIVLLWGEKSQLNTEALKGTPLYSYKEIIELGRDHRSLLINSCKEGIGSLINRG